MNQAPSSISDSKLAVELSDVWKSFPGVTANAGVNLSVRTGTIHALLGENGAGKSTLMNILAGVYRPDSGELRIHGHSQQFRTRRRSQRRNWNGPPRVPVNPIFFSG